MKNLFFIFLISIFLFSCNKENTNLQPFDPNSQHYLKSALDGDSIKQSVGNDWLTGFYSRLFGNSEYLIHRFEFIPDNRKGDDGAVGRSMSFVLVHKMEKVIFGSDSLTNQLSCVQRKEYIKIGKYPFGREGNYFYPYDTPNDGIKKGVEIVFREANVGYGMDKQWFSSMLPQPKESYFEITEVIPDAINPDLLRVKARFSCLLARQEIKLSTTKTFSGEMKGVVICTGK